MKETTKKEEEELQEQRDAASRDYLFSQEAKGSI